MTLGTIAVVVVLAAIVTSVIYSRIKVRRAGNGPSCSGCSGCSGGCGIGQDSDASCGHHKVP